MSETEKGTDTAGAADQQKTVESSSAGVQQTTNPADGENQEDKVKAFQTKAEDEVKKRQAAEQEAENLKQQMMLLQNNQAPTPQVQAQPKTLFEQCITQLGFDGDYLTAEQHGQVLQLMIQVQGNIANTQSFIQNHPDFIQVAGTINQNGQLVPSTELQKILTEKPQLRALTASPQGAYELVMQERQLAKLTQENAVQAEHLKQQGIDTTLAPVSGAAAVTGAVTSKTPAVVTAQQQAEMEDKVARGEFNT